MAQEFKYGAFRRIVNKILVFLLRYDLAPKIYYLLTTTGRKSGLPHSIPVVIVEEDNKKWLVAPYGVVDWVKNARAVTKVALSRGRDSVEYEVHEVSPEEGAPILKRYLEMFPITKSYFDSRMEDSLREFINDARSRPVFELRSVEF